MSYDLIYRKLFVNLGNGKFIPMIECGSSNCYESNSNKRVRDWHVHSWAAPDHSATMEDMLNEYKKDFDDMKTRHDDYDPKSYGWFSSLSVNGKHTSKTSEGDMLGLIKTGCKNALTFAQLSEYGIVLYYELSNYQASGSEWFHNDMGLPSEYRITSLEDFIYAKRLVGQHEKDHNARYYLQLKGGIDRYFYKKKRENINKRYEARLNRVMPDKVYIIQLVGGFLIRKASKGVRYTTGLSEHYKQYARKYMTLSSAEKAASDIRRWIGTPVNVIAYEIKKPGI